MRAALGARDASCARSSARQAPAGAGARSRLGARGQGSRLAAVPTINYARLGPALWRHRLWLPGRPLSTFPALVLSFEHREGSSSRRHASGYVCASAGGDEQPRRSAGATRNSGRANSTKVRPRSSRAPIQSAQSPQRRRGPISPVAPPCPTRQASRPSATRAPGSASMPPMDKCSPRVTPSHALPISPSGRLAPPPHANEAPAPTLPKCGHPSLTWRRAVRDAVHFGTSPRGRPHAARRTRSPSPSRLRRPALTAAGASRTLTPGL